MISCGTEILKPKLIEIWKRCFDDSDEFVRFYFNKIYHEDNTLVLLSDEGLPVSSLQILPYQIKTGNKMHNAGYISGAMTHPGHRKKGYMQQLLNAAFEEMKKKHYTFTFLIPQEEWLFDFYAKYGYEKAFPITTEIVNLVNIDIDSKDVEVYTDFENLPLEEIYHLYAGFLYQKENTVLKTKEQFCLILEDLFLEKGHVFYLKENGVAFATKEEEKISIKEIFYGTDDCKQLLLSAAGRNFQSNKVIIRNAQPDNDHLYGMIKVLDNSYTKAIPENIYMNMMLN